MRDINRIEPFMRAITEAWKNSAPDMRFGQFMCNILGEMGKNGDVFFFEEDKFIKELEKISWIKMR